MRDEWTGRQKFFTKHFLVSLNHDDFFQYTELLYVEQRYITIQLCKDSLTQTLTNKCHLNVQINPLVPIVYPKLVFQIPDRIQTDSHNVNHQKYIVLLEEIEINSLEAAKKCKNLNSTLADINSEHDRMMIEHLLSNSLFNNVDKGSLFITYCRMFYPLCVTFLKSRPGVSIHFLS